MKKKGEANKAPRQRLVAGTSKEKEIGRGIKHHRRNAVAQNVDGGGGTIPVKSAENKDVWMGHQGRIGK